jgi:hypothetical protein
LGDEPPARLTRSSKFDLMAQLQNVVLQGHVDAFNRLVFVLGHLEKYQKFKAKNSRLAISNILNTSHPIIQMSFHGTQ